MSMLNYDEALFLIKKDALKVGSGVTILGLSKNSSDEYMVKSINVGPKLIIITINTDSGNERKFRHNAITHIDGMDSHKLYEAYKDNNNDNTKDDDVIVISGAINVSKDVVGKRFIKIGNYIVNNGDKILFENDLSKKYTNKVYTVKGVGVKISLAGKRGRPKKSNA